MFTRFSKAEIEQSIPERFEEMVRRFPERLAADEQERSRSYAALNREANRIAHAVFEAQARVGEPVVLLLEQGVPLIAAILGVLKAGGLYVPLDPGLAAPRLADIVTETGTALIVASGATRSLASRILPSAARVLDLDAIPAGTSDQDVDLPISPDADCYIYYTSGSTGRPKGVVDTHRNVLHNIMRYTNSLSIGPEDRMTLLQGPGFSGAVSSLFGALLNENAPRQDDLSTLPRPLDAGVRTTPLDAGLGQGCLCPPRDPRLVCAGAHPPSARARARRRGRHPRMSDVRAERARPWAQCPLEQGELDHVGTPERRDSILPPSSPPGRRPPVQGHG